MTTIAEDFHLACIGDDEEFWEDLVEPLSGFKAATESLNFSLSAESKPPRCNDSILDMSRSDCGFTCPYPELSIGKMSAMQANVSMYGSMSCNFVDPRHSLDQLTERCFKESVQSNHINDSSREFWEVC